MPPALAGRFFTTSATWEALICRALSQILYICKLTYSYNNPNGGYNYYLYVAAMETETEIK